MKGRIDGQSSLALSIMLTSKYLSVTKKNKKIQLIKIKLFVAYSWLNKELPFLTGERWL